MSTEARHGMVLTLGIAIAWYCLPVLCFPRISQMLHHTGQYLQQAELHPEQTLVYLLLKFEPLGDVFRRTL